MSSKEYVTVTRITNVHLPVVMMRRGTIALRRALAPGLFGEHIDLIEPTENALVIMNRGMVYGDLDMAPTGLFEHRIIRDLPLAIDVHFPFFSPDEIICFGADGVFDEEATIRTQDFWRRPEHRYLADVLLNRAKVLTTPYESWAEQLRRGHDNVMVLPDVVDARSAEAFVQTFIFDVMHACFWGNVKPSPWLRIKHAFVRRMARTFSLPTVKQIMLQEFEKVSWQPGSETPVEP